MKIATLIQHFITLLYGMYLLWLLIGLWYQFKGEQFRLLPMGVFLLGGIAFQFACEEMK